MNIFQSLLELLEDRKLCPPQEFDVKLYKKLLLSPARLISAKKIINREPGEGVKWVFQPQQPRSSLTRVKASKIESLQGAAYNRRI